MKINESFMHNIRLYALQPLALGCPSEDATRAIYDGAYSPKGVSAHTDSGSVKP